MSRKKNTRVQGVSSKNQKKITGLRSREGYWHYRFKVNKQEYSGNTGLPDTRPNVSAALEVRAMERQRILGGARPAPEIFPFNKAADGFLKWCKGEYQDHESTGKRIRTSFASLKAFFRNTPVLNIHAGTIEDYKSYRRGNDIKEVTIRHDLHNLSLFFQYAKRQRWCADNPVKEVAIPSDEDAVRMRILTEEEENRFFATALQVSQDLYDTERIMLLQGCRPEEVFSLEQASINLRDGLFKVTRGKSKAARRTLVMMRETRKILQHRLKTPGKWVFPSRVKPGRCITKINNAHNRACEISGMDIVPYDLRHTFASRMAHKGCPVANLAGILGHANLRSVHKYIHPGQENLDDSMARYGADAKAKKASAAGAFRKGDGPSAFRPLAQVDEEGSSWFYAPSE